jgi:hypothetical protein
MSFNDEIVVFTKELVEGLEAKYGYGDIDNLSVKGGDKVKKRAQYTLDDF